MNLKYPFINNPKTTRYLKRHKSSNTYAAQRDIDILQIMNVCAAEEVAIDWNWKGWGPGIIINQC